MPGSSGGSDSPPSDGLARLDDASNILVCSSTFEGGKREARGRLLGGPNPENRTALVVTYTESADGWLTQYEQVTERFPEHLTIVSVGEATRSVGGPESTSSRPPSHPGGPAVDAIENPADLTGLGIKLTEHLRAFGTDRWDDGPTEAVVCFDSVTALLQYTDLQSAFRFLHILTGKVKDIDATAHYHIDPAAHDTQTISTLQSVFDAQLDSTAGEDLSEWSVKRA